MTLKSHKIHYIKEMLFFSILGPFFGGFIFCFITSIPVFYKNMEIMTLIKSTFIGGLYGGVIENAHLVGFIPMISTTVLYILTLERIANKSYNNVLTRIALCFFIAFVVCFVFYKLSPLDFHLLNKHPWKTIISGSLGAVMVATFTKSMENYDPSPKINLKRLFTMFFLLPAGWCALAFYMSIFRIHHWFLGFIAANISNSCTSHASLACDGFYWDSNLQLASYLTYATIFSLFFILTIYFAKTKKSKSLQFIASSGFIILFPSYIESWQVEVYPIHYGEPYQSTSGFIVPQIMCLNHYFVITIILSLIIVYFINHTSMKNYITKN